MVFFFFHDTPPTEIYTLSLHDALPICLVECHGAGTAPRDGTQGWAALRSEEHTSELQSRGHLVCRLLLEKKNTSATTDAPPPSSAQSTPSPASSHRTISTVPSPEPAQA